MLRIQTIQSLVVYCIKLFTRTNLSSWPKYLFDCTSAFSRFDADLKIMSICKLKFNLLSIWAPKILTFEITLMFSLSTVKFSFRYKSEFLLSNEIAWNFWELTIRTNLWYSHFRIPKCLEDYLGSLQNLRRYYHRRNYEQTRYAGQKKSLKIILNKIGPTIEPCGTPDLLLFENYCLC